MRSLAQATESTRASRTALGPAVPWSRFAREAPRLAELGEALLERYRMAFLGTTTAAAEPRVHPVCPAVLDGHLLIGVRRATPKYGDLRRDPRCVLHALPGEGDQEFLIRAVAREPADSRIRELAAAPDGSGVLVDEQDSLFELLIRAAFTARYEVEVADGQADYRATRAAWRPGRQPIGDNP
jgi:hypothetical protein